MSSQEKKLLVRRYIEEVVNTGNVDAIADFISRDYVEVLTIPNMPSVLKEQRSMCLVSAGPILICM